MKTIKQVVLAMIAVTVSAANAQQAVIQPAVETAAQAQQVSRIAIASPQVKDDLFAGTEKFAQGASDVSEVNLDPKMMGMLGDKAPKGIAGKMSYIVVHAYKYDKPGMYRMEDIEIYRKKLMDGSWNCIVHARTKDNSSDICSRSGVGSDHESSEMVILTAAPQELAFIHLSGHLSLEDLVKMKDIGGGKDLKRR